MPEEPGKELDDKIQKQIDDLVHIKDGQAEAISKIGKKLALHKEEHFSRDQLRFVRKYCEKGLRFCNLKEALKGTGISSSTYYLWMRDRKFQIFFLSELKASSFGAMPEVFGSIEREACAGKAPNQALFLKIHGVIKEPEIRQTLIAQFQGVDDQKLNAHIAAMPSMREENEDPNTGPEDAGGDGTPCPCNETEGRPDTQTPGGM